MTEKFRPIAHFSPRTGWTNDPNGLCFYAGKYHLFYQHFPDMAHVGAMHWGHAVSEDLIHWEPLPIAIYPDDVGVIFSGSAVADTENRSGLSPDDRTPLIAIYTRHGAVEEQAMAYSLDGVHFTPYAHNPIIPNPGISDFRDPKLFWNPVRNTWSLVLAAKDRVQFYASENLLDWEKTGEFDPEGNHSIGVWECPDMIPLEFEGRTLWVLIVSMTIPKESGGTRTQYFIGEFDGDAFHCTQPFGHMETIDEGSDNYAGVSFNNLAADEAPTLLCWGMNWDYAFSVPTQEYKGQMTFARRLSLVPVRGKPRLACQAVLPPLGEARTLESGARFTASAYVLRVQGEGPCRVRLMNGQNEAFVFGVNAQNEVFVDRREEGESGFAESFASPTYAVRQIARLAEGAYDIELACDACLYELSIDGGTRVLSTLAYPGEPYDRVEFAGVRVTLREMLV